MDLGIIIIFLPILHLETLFSLCNMDQGCLGEGVWESRCGCGGQRFRRRGRRSKSDPSLGAIPLVFFAQMCDTMSDSNVYNVLYMQVKKICRYMIMYTHIIASIQIESLPLPIHHNICGIGIDIFESHDVQVRPFSVRIGTKANLSESLWQWRWAVNPREASPDTGSIQSSMKLGPGMRFIDEEIGGQMPECGRWWPIM